MVKDDCTKDIAELLLQGWAMLAESCPNCNIPLMRNPRTKIEKCVGCSSSVPSEERSGPAQADTPLSEPQPEDSFSFPVPDSTSTAETQSDRDVGEIAKKLLAGWALLDDYCPACNTPLVRNREKRKFCVHCSSFIEPKTLPQPAVSEAPLVQEARANITESTQQQSVVLQPPTNLQAPMAAVPHVLPALVSDSQALAEGLAPALPVDSAVCQPGTKYSCCDVLDGLEQAILAQLCAASSVIRNSDVEGSQAKLRLVNDLMHTLSKVREFSR